MKLILISIAITSMACFEKTEYSFFKNMSNEEIAGRYLGLRTDFLQDTMLSMFLESHGTDQDLPESFDWREKMPDCVHPVRDQGKCGSCWAHAASEVVSDRFCIQSQGQVNVTFSPQQLVDCDFSEMACSGGFLTNPFIYYSLLGANTDECYGEYVSGRTGGRSKFCFLTNWSCKAYRTNLFSIKWLKNPQAIKEEIYKNGPVNTGFMVYSDFLEYKSGIYVQNSQKLLGGHAVKIVGWGSEEGVEYWIVQNSWTTNWGENGFFKIKIGQCNIDSGAVSVNPSL
jgi:cathepsin B